MRLSFADSRVLAVVAHPDDAELLCAGTLARAAAEGAAVGICVMCRGDKGQPPRRIANLTAVRRGEMHAAARLLGAEVYLTAIPDGTLSDCQPVRRKLMDVYRRFRPTLVLAHAAEDYHPDHRAASQLAEAVSWFAASPGQVTRQPPLSEPPELWWMDTIEMLAFEPGFYVDISSVAEIKLKMLACHKSQLARKAGRDFAPLAEVIEMQMRTRGMQSGVAAAEAFRVHHAFKRTRAW